MSTSGGQRSSSSTTRAPSVRAPGSKKAGDVLRSEAAQMRNLIDPEFENRASYEEATKFDYDRMRAATQQLSRNKAWQSMVRTWPTAEIDVGSYHYSKPMMVYNAIVASWTSLEMDSDATASAMRMAANDVFHLTEARGARTQGYGADSIQQRQQMAREFYQEHGAALRAVVKVMYKDTQKWFASHGISEVTVYRGSKSDTPKSDVKYNGKVSRPSYRGSAFTSFSTDPSLAHGYATSAHYLGSTYRSVIAARIPVKDIFGTPFTSPAKRGESEMLVLGRPQSWHAVGWTKDGAQPSVDTLLNQLGQSFSRPPRSSGGASSRRKKAA